MAEKFPRCKLEEMGEYLCYSWDREDVPKIKFYLRITALEYLFSVQQIKIHKAPQDIIKSIQPVG